MKRLLIISLLTLAVWPCGAARKKSTPTQVYTPLPAQYDGSMAMLDTLAYAPLEIPDTLRPVFLDYVARHGARYMSSAKKTETLRHVIRVAAERGILSEEGEVFGRMLASLDSASAGRWGLLSPEGYAEQQFLGRWMLRQFPELTGHGNVRAISSYVPRVVQTMYSLTTTLLTDNAHEQAVSISTAEGKEYDPLVRFFESDRQYEEYLDKGEWTPIYSSWLRHNVPAGPAERLFKADSGLRDEILRTLTMHIYGVLQSLRCSGLGEPTTRWMTVDEYRRCWEAENLDKYLRRTWTSVSDEPARAAVPLLMALVNAADEAIRGETRRLSQGAEAPAGRTAMMYFGHAETLLPLFSLMNLPGCNAIANDWTDLAEKWKDWQIVPMGANLSIVILGSVTDHTYAAVCLNGRWIDPLHDGRRIVPYAALRAYWLERAVVATRNSTK